MDNPVLVVEAPILDDETAVKVYRFLQRITDAFQANYYTQLDRHYQKHKDFYYGGRTEQEVKMVYGRQAGLKDDDIRVD